MEKAMDWIYYMILQILGYYHSHIWNPQHNDSKNRNLIYDA
jgi:hypothetical protein